MKKFLIPICTIVLISCGNKAEGEANAATDSTKTENAVATNNILDPVSGDFSKPIDPFQLKESMMACYNKEIQLVIYPIPFFDTDKFAQDQAATVMADSKDKTISINFKTLPDIEFTRNTPFVIKCKLKEISIWNDKKELLIIDAELVGEAKNVKTETFNASTFTPAAVYNSKDVLANVLAWNGKQVTIIGDYNGTTTSKRPDGSIMELRADITDAGGNSTVGCNFTEDPAIEAGARGIKISGKTDLVMHYDNPYLNNCQVVK
jgi:hypothetical protein